MKSDSDVFIDLYIVDKRAIDSVGAIAVGCADQLLKTTRSVRKRLDLDRAVDLSIVEECLTIAMQAPNGSNNQNWNWVVVTDPDRRAALGSLYRRAFEPYLEMGSGGKLATEISAGGEQSDAARKQAERLMGQDRIMSSVRHLVDNLSRVPVLVLPCIRGRPSIDAPTVWVASMYASIYPAVWSFQLALRARGLGSCLTTAHLGLEHEAADILGIPPNVLQVGLIPVAHYTGTGFRPAVRKDPRQAISWETWANRQTAD